MTNLVKEIINKGFYIFGIDIRKIPKWEKNKYIWLQDMNINTILDIGANEGQFAKEIHRAFPNAAIYSFEPLNNCFKRLQTKTQNIREFKSFMFALGDFNGETYIYKNEFSPSSSILEMREFHKEIFPHTKSMIKEKIVVKRLDDVIREFTLTIKDNLLIKIDVQGYEDKVISGGKDTLSKAKIIIIEVSFVELYKKQVLFDYIYSLLADLGFKYAGNLTQIISPKDARPIQADAVFLKNF